MDEITLKLSKQEVEHIFDALDIYNYVEMAVKDAKGIECSNDDPLAMKIANYLGWSDDYCNKRSDEVCNIIDEFNEINFDDELIMRQAEDEVEKDIKAQNLNPNHEERFRMLSYKYDEIRERMGLEPKL